MTLSAWSLVRTGSSVMARGLTLVEGVCFGNGGPARPPIFIVGLPRAGTTLFYQLMCHCFAVSYPAELTNSLPFAPSLATWLSRRLRGQATSDFTSDYGKASRFWDPGECTAWNLWFDKDVHYRSGSALDARRRREIQRFVGRIERIGDGPFINKNLRHDNRIPALAELFPGAMFLVVVRSPEETAASLLKGREKLLGDRAAWFSIRPRHAEGLAEAEPVRQVVLQVHGLIEDLREDIAAVGTDRFAAVDYKAICDRPAAVVDDVQRFFEASALAVRRIEDTPERFLRSGGVSGLTEHDQELLARAVSQAFEGDDYRDLGCRLLGAEDKAT